MTKQKRSKVLCCIKHGLPAHMMFCVVAPFFPTSGSSQKAQRRYKRIEFITGYIASIRGAYRAPQPAPLNHVRREKNSTSKDNVKEKMCTRHLEGNSINQHVTGLFGVYRMQFTSVWTSGHQRYENEHVPTMPFFYRGVEQNSKGRRKILDHTMIEPIQTNQLAWKLARLGCQDEAKHGTFLNWFNC